MQLFIGPVLFIPWIYVKYAREKAKEGSEIEPDFGKDGVCLWILFHFVVTTLGWMCGPGPYLIDRYIFNISSSKTYNIIIPE